MSKIKVFNVLNHNSYGKPLTWFLKNSILTIGKIIIYALYSSIGKTDVLVSKRSRKPVPKELQLTKEDLEKAVRK